jgi:hypothetical protein
MIWIRKKGKPYRNGLNITIEVSKFQGHRLVALETCLKIGRYSIYTRQSYTSKHKLKYKGYTSRIFYEG